MVIGERDGGVIGGGGVGDRIVGGDGGSGVARGFGGGGRGAEGTEVRGKGEDNVEIVDIQWGEPGENGFLGRLLYGYTYQFSELISRGGTHAFGR